jgi:branched-subunit amino acid transport protein
MSWELILILAAITYGSRAAALAFLPRLPNRVRLVIDRMPPALFAGLAVHSLVAPGGGLTDAATLAGAVAAVAVAPFRSLLICLIAGVAAYVGWSTLF